MRNPNCTRCPLSKTATSICISGEGPPDARLMVIGESPGEQEDRDGRPFVGAAGQLLDELLEEAGLHRSDVWITNTVRCRPPYNRDPHVGEIAACMSYLLEEIDEIKPQVIIPLGNVALKALTDKTGITNARGKIQPPRRGLHTGAKILPTIHPAAVLRPEGGGYRQQIVEDLRLAANLSKPLPVDDSARLILPTTPVADALRFLEPLERAGHLTADAEWTAQDHSVWPWSKRGELFSLSLSGYVDGALYSVATAWPPPDEVRERLKWLLGSHKVVFHNAMADMMWARAEGMEPSLAGDTMLLAYLLDERAGRSLEAVATRFAPNDVRPGWKGVLYSERPADTAEWERLLSYNAEDTRATLLAFGGLALAVSRLPAERRAAVTRLHKNLLLPAVPTLMEAAFRGVPIDGVRLKEETAKALTIRQQTAEKLADVVGCSPPQAAKLALSPEKTLAYLRRAYKLDIDDTQKNSLEVHSLEFPAVRGILDYRKWNKLIGTYLRPWGRMLEQQGDGRLHTIYRMTGTRTGRLSAEVEYGASIQVAPRDTPEVEFRQLVRSEPGRVIVSADYGQIELRVIAWLANEPTMRQFYREGLDLHTMTAAYLIACKGKPIRIEQFMEERERWMALVTKPQRQAAKASNFGLAFGQGDEGFRVYALANYGVELTSLEAQQTRAGWFRLYSRLLSWQEQSMFDAEERGYTETPFGRRRQFEPNDVHAAINTPIQSTASDLTMLAMNAVYVRYKREGLDAVIVGFIHDSVIVDASEAHADRAADILVEEMVGVDVSPFGFTIPVPLTADRKISTTWS